VEEEEEVLNKSKKKFEPTDLDESRENSEGHGECAHGIGEDENKYEINKLINDEKNEKENIEPSCDVSVNVDISENNQLSEESNKTGGDKQEKKSNPDDVQNNKNIETEKQVTTELITTEPKAEASDKTKPSSMGAHAGWDPDIKKKE
jgi:hypothetical protein